MTDEQNKPLGRGRGGRGALIRQAMESSSRQPGSQSSAPTQSGESSSKEFSSGYASGSSPQAGVSSDSSPQTPKGRAALMAKFIKERQSRGSSVPLSKGRGELLKNLSKIEAERKEEDSGSRSLSDEVSSLSIHTEESNEPAPIIRHGKTGATIETFTNWIPIQVEPNKAVFEYAVMFSPAVDSLKLRFALLNSVRDQIGNVKSFDGAKLWLPIKLPNPVTKLTAEDRNTGDEITISIKFICRTVMSKCLQLYNVLFKRVMKTLRYHLVGKSYFSPKESILVPQYKLEIWPGYVTAAQHREGGVFLCVDVSHKVLRTSTVYEVLEEIAHCQRANFEQAVMKALVGSVVLTRYNNKCYRIDDILFDTNPQSTFSSTRGEVSYIDYYKNAHNITIQDAKQPMLLHKAKKRDVGQDGERMICLVPEICYMTGLTDEMRTDFRVMKDLAQHTRVTPSTRQACLRKFIRHVNDTPEAKQILSDWGLILCNDSARLTGRVLPPERIIFGSKEVEGSPMADFSRECVKERVIEPIDVHSRLWLVLYHKRDEQCAKKFVTAYRQVTGALGIMVGEPVVVSLPGDSIESYLSGIKKHYSDQLQLAVVIFPTQREDRYSAVKQLSYSSLGLPSQCINARTIRNDTKLRSVTQKIALQINCKLGGQLWAVKIPVSGLMVCGVDVYHDPVRRGKSVVGFVGSLNPDLTKWFSHAIFQNPGEEIINGMKTALLETLRKYYEEHHELPKSIVLYRDGVSDGCLKITEEHEIPQITSVFQNFDGYNPYFYFVVVQKRINTRIFASLNGRGVDNPPPGSIVDHTITKRHWYDFLLVSQHVRQGTVTPTHYVVVHDGDKMTPDQLQRLTYKLTHLYYNWPGTIRVPAPCQYAHKLAYLVGQNMRKPVNEKLRDRLFFL